MKPLVSIIIPIYNVEKYIDDCLKSVVNQTFRNIEIILVNDGTKDNSMQIVKRYAESDGRIKVINKINGGLSSARNAGLDIAKGDYIVFVDSDDFIENNMIEEMYNTAYNNNSDIIMCGYNRVNTDFVYKVKPPIDCNIKYNKVDIYNIITNSQNYITWFVWRNMYKSDLLNNNKIRFNESVKIGEDSCFNLEAFLSSNSIMCIDKELYNYRNNPNSLTQKKYQTNLEEILIIQYNEKIKIYKTHNMNKNAFVNLDLSFITHSLNSIISNIYNGTSNNKLKELKKIRNIDIVKTSLNNITLSEIIKSKNAKGIKLRTILIKYKLFILLDKICER